MWLKSCRLTDSHGDDGKSFFSPLQWKMGCKTTEGVTEVTGPGCTVSASTDVSFRTTWGENAAWSAGSSSDSSSPRWRSTTAPFAPGVETNEAGGGVNWGSRGAPSSQPVRATRLSAPLWGSHILACTCLWRVGIFGVQEKPWGSPVHVGWSTGPQPEEKAAVMREKERIVYPGPLCAFNHLPSCLPQPCPHNRVLTGAVSRQRYCDHCGHWG